MKGLATLLGGLGLVCVGFGLLSLLMALLAYEPSGVFFESFSSWVTGNIALGVILLSASLFMGFDQISERLRSGEGRRVSKYGTSAITSMMFSIVILGLLAFLAYRSPVRWKSVV